MKFLITGGSKLNCPRCGSVCDRINNAATTRFIKCEACSHLFVVLSENENKSRGGKSFPGKEVFSRAGTQVIYYGLRQTEMDSLP